MNPNDTLSTRRQVILDAMAPDVASMFGAHALFATCADVAAGADRVEEIVTTRFGAQSASPFADVSTPSERCSCSAAGRMR
jgi:hypothetical protein